MFPWVKTVVALTLMPILAAACGSSTTASGPSAPGVTAQEIKIGTNNAVTGPTASACKPVSDGSAAWYADVNAKGGIHGRQITVDLLDDGNQAPTAVANMRQLMSDGVFAVVGGCGTAGAVAIAPIAQQNNIPYMFPYAAVTSLYTPPIHNVFMTIPAYSDQVKALLNYQLPKLPKGKSVMLVTNETPGYQDSGSNAEASAKAAGDTWLGYDHFPLGTTSYGAEATKIAHLHADYLAMPMGIADGALLAKAMADTGYIPNVEIGNSVLASDQFLSPGGYLLGDHLIAGSPQTLVTAPQGAACAKVLTAHKVPVNSYSMYGCAVAHIFTNALEKAGSNPTRSQLIDALESMKNVDIPGLAPVSFSRTNHLGVSPSKMFLFKIQPGTKNLEQAGAM
jgi:branched-chain amino acid transport system substrate-binding protein